MSKRVRVTGSGKIMRYGHVICFVFMCVIIYIYIYVCVCVCVCVIELVLVVVTKLNPTRGRRYCR